MSTDTKEMEVSKEELQPEVSERTRDCRCFVPKSDIYETEEHIFVVVDMPGVQNDNIEISLEKNVLTVNGLITLDEPSGSSLAFAEYESGDYERSFRLSNQIDQGNIEAKFTRGVLRLSLPKTEAAKKRKIEVRVA